MLRVEYYKGIWETLFLKKIERIQNIPKKTVPKIYQMSFTYSSIGLPFLIRFATSTIALVSR